MRILLISGLVSLALAGCAPVSLGVAATKAAVKTTKVAVKTTGNVVTAIIP